MCKKLEPIKDNRLTSTMDSVRSGNIQLFREKNPKDRSLISSENADVILQHENQEMYAVIIDEKWYWKNGCHKCDSSEDRYVTCKKHDVCENCGCSETPQRWGVFTGWICKDCNDKKRLLKRNRAFEKLRGDEPDTDYMDSVICPHCGTDHGGYNQSDTEDTCDVCGGNFEIESEYTIHYTTTVIGERIKR